MEKSSLFPMRLYRRALFNTAHLRYSETRWTPRSSLSYPDDHEQKSTARGNGNKGDQAGESRSVDADRTEQEAYRNKRARGLRSVNDDHTGPDAYRENYRSVRDTQLYEEVVGECAGV